MAAKAKATREQLEALERELAAHGIRPRVPAHPLQERPSDALRDALANGLGIGTTKEAAGFLAGRCGCSDRATREWLRNSRKMNRDQVALALDALADGILSARRADGPYAEEIANAEQDAILNELYQASFETPEERAGRYAFELLFMGMAEADRAKVLELEAMRAITLLGTDSLEALLDLLESMGACGAQFTKVRLRDAEKPGNAKLAAAWADCVLRHAEELKEWADRRRKEPDEPLPPLPPLPF